MLAQNAIELVHRCHQHSANLMDKEAFKDAFIQYVFGDYQQEVLNEHDLEDFYEHLADIKLSRCRIDFDLAVEEWFERQYEAYCDEGNFHDLLFSLIREVISKHRATTREQLINSLTKFLTSPTGFMQRWKNDTKRTISSYFAYVAKLGIRTYNDIEALVDVWLIEHPDTFDAEQQKQLVKRRGRGRPQNQELSQLIEQALKIKPFLTHLEKERIRKIYYYYRKSMNLLDMIEKFRSYLLSQAQTKEPKPFNPDPNTIQVG